MELHIASLRVYFWDLVLGFLDWIEIGTNEGIELGLRDGKILETTLGAPDGFLLGTYYGVEIG